MTSIELDTDVKLNICGNFREERQARESEFINISVGNVNKLYIHHVRAGRAPGLTLFMKINADSVAIG